MKILYTDSDVKNLLLIAVPGYKVVYMRDLYTDLQRVATDYDVLIYGETVRSVHTPSLYDNCKASARTALDCRRVADDVMLNIINDSGIINAPPTIPTADITTMVTSMSYRPYIVKALSRARSLGLHIVKDRYELINMLISIYYASTDAREFNAKYHIDEGRVLNDDDERYALHSALKSGQFLLQETVEVLNEFRVIYTEGTNCEDYVVGHRIGYSPGSDIDRYSSTVMPDSVDPSVVSAVRKIAREFGEYLKAPAVALDIYQTVDGTYGMFEYAYTFGIGYEPSVLRTISEQFSRAIAGRLGVSM